MSNSFIAETKNGCTNQAKILIVVNNENILVDETSLRRFAKKENLSLVQLTEDKSGVTDRTMAQNSGNNFFSSIDQEELYKIEQALTSEQAKQILGDSLSGILEEDEEPILEYFATTDSGVEGDENIDAEELESGADGLGLLQLITMDHCYSAAPFQRLAEELENVDIHDSEEEAEPTTGEIIHEEIELQPSVHEETVPIDRECPPSPPRRSQRQVDKAEREQVEKILAENYELLRKEKIMQQGDKTSEKPIDEKEGSVGRVRRRSRKSTTSSRPESSLSMKVDEEGLDETQDEVEEEVDIDTDADSAREASEEESGDESLLEIKKKVKKTPVKAEKSQTSNRRRLYKKKPEKAPPREPTPELPKEGDLPTALPESKVKTLRTQKEVEVLSAGLIAVGVKKVNPDVKAAIERLQKEPENNGKNHPISEPVNDEKKYPKRERKIPAYLREMEIGPALFTPDNLKPKGQKDDNKSRHTEAAKKSAQEAKHRNKGHKASPNKSEKKDRVKGEIEEEKEEEREVDEQGSEAGESEESWHSEDDPDKLWCICRKPHNNRFMICCDKCEEWFHGNCVGVTRAMGKEMEERGEEWICPPCKKEAKKRQREELESSAKKQEEENLKRQKQNASTLSNEPPTKQSKPQDPSRNADIRNYMVVESKDSTPSNQRVKCVIKSCKNSARSSSIYCSDKCVITHAQETIPESASYRPLSSQTKSVKREDKRDDSNQGPELEKNTLVRAKHRERTSPIPKDNGRKGKSFGDELMSNEISDRHPLGKHKTPAKNITPPMLKTEMRSKNREDASSEESASERATGQRKHYEKSMVSPIPKAEPRKVMMLAEAPPPPSRHTQVKVERIPVYDTSTGSLLQGSKAPLATELELFLKQHPNYEVYKPDETPVSKFYGSSKTYENKRKRSESESKTNDEKSKKEKKRKSEAEETPKENPGSQLKEFRQKIQSGFYDSLSQRKTTASDIKISDEQISKLAEEIEEQLFSLFNGDTGMKYKTRYRSLIFNIKDLKNEGLFRKILTGQIKPDHLVRMTADELASEELAEWRQKESQHQMEIILQTENEILSMSHNRVVKTHKGEAIIEERENKHSQENKVDDLATMHSAHTTIDPTCVLCTGKMISEEDVQTKDTTVKISEPEVETVVKVEKSKRSRSRERKHSSSKDSSDHHRRDRDRHQKHHRRHHDEKKRDGKRHHDSGENHHDDHHQHEDKKKDRRVHDSDEKQSKKSKLVSHKEERKVIESKEKKTRFSPEIQSDFKIKPESDLKEETEVRAPSRSRHHSDSRHGESVKQDEIKLSEPLKDVKSDEVTAPAEGAPLNVPPVVSKNVEEEPEPSELKDVVTSTLSQFEVEQSPFDNSDLTEFYDEPSSTIKTPDWNVVSPVQPPAKVWKGSISVTEIGKFHAVAFEVSKAPEEFHHEVRSHLTVVGRIKPDQVAKYLNEVRKSASREIMVLRFDFCQPADQRCYESTFKHLLKKGRYGVLNPLPPSVKDFYIVPLASNAPVPEMILPIDGPGFEEPRPDLLIGVVVRVREKVKFGRSGKAALRDEGFDTLSPSTSDERRHGSYRRSKHLDHLRAPDSVSNSPMGLYEEAYSSPLSYVPSESPYLKDQMSLAEIDKQIEMQRKEIDSLAKVVSPDETGFIPGLGGPSEIMQADSDFSLLSRSEAKKPKLLNEMGDVDLRTFNQSNSVGTPPLGRTTSSSSVEEIGQFKRDPRQRAQTSKVYQHGASLKDLSEEELVRKAREMEEEMGAIQPLPQPSIPPPSLMHPIPNFGYMNPPVANFYPPGQIPYPQLQDPEIQLVPPPPHMMRRNF